MNELTFHIPAFVGVFFAAFGGFILGIQYANDRQAKKERERMAKGLLRIRRKDGEK